jgi:NADH:ubiquinone oxidoreductase subunit
MLFLKQLFTWWSGQTLNTRFYTWWKGELVGEDENGNRYYRAPSTIPDSIAERRWVIFNGYSEASVIPPGWHGWIHHRTNTPPGPYKPREWEKPHVANQTGTAAAYHPPGSIASPTRARQPAPDYQAWKPE